MERTDFSQHRVLVVGAKNHAVQLLRSVLGIAGVGKITHVEDGRRALELLGMEHFSAVFCDYRLDKAGGKPFVVAARRSDSMLNPMIPIFMLQERARRRDVEKARDTGATDVLTVPISPKTLVDKLYAATQEPRPFIVANAFFGPDRRGKARPTYFGPDRRTRVSKKAKIDLTHI
jgi:two-component system chemotaxis response regulator CheY